MENGKIEEVNMCFTNFWTPIAQFKHGVHQATTPDFFYGLI